MTRNIYLEGELALKFGAQHSFHGDSVRDALRLLDANRPGFKKYFIDAADCDIGFHIEVGGQELDNPLECLLPLREGDIIITPIAGGSKSGGAKILTAIAIATLLFIPGGAAAVGLHGTMSSSSIFAALQGAGYAAVGTAAASIAANLAITGIQQLMAPDPAVDEEDVGYLFNGSEQNIVEGMPIPLLYGELRVPGYPVSFEMIQGNKRVTHSDTIITYRGDVYRLRSGVTMGDYETALEKGQVDILKIADPISGATAGASSQDILFTDIISEGPIYGLVDGGTSVFLNDDPAQLTDQSLVRTSDTPVEFNFTFNSTSVIINKNGHTKDIQADTENGTKFIVVRNYGSSSASVVRSSVTGSANSVTITSSAEVFTPVMEYDRINLDQLAIIRLLDSNSSTIFEGYVENYVSSTVAKCIPLPGTDLNPALSNGNYTVVIDGKFQVASVSGNSLTLTSSFPGNTGNYKCDLSGTNYPAVSLIDGVPRGSKYNSFELQFRTGNITQPAFSDAEGTGVGSIALGPGGSFTPFSPVLYNNPVNGTNNAIVEYTGTSASGFGLTAPQAEEVDEVRVTFSYPQLWNRNEKGELGGGRAKYNMSIALKKEGSFGEYQRIESVDADHRAKSNGPRIFEEIVNMRQYQPFTDFKIKIQRITNNDQAYDSNQLTVNTNYTTQSDCSITSLNSIIKENLSYPLTAMAKVRINSKDFQNVPTRTYHCKGVKVKVPSNYVTRDEGANSVATYNRNVSTGAITSSYQDWDGNFRADKVYTNNPAWVFYDILTNNRYGLGEWLNEDEIDKYALYRIARYCDELVPDGNGGLEPRFTTNVYFSKASDAYKIVKDLATVFRSMIYWVDGEVYTIADQPGDPIYNFSKSNVIDGAFGYETTGSKTRANQIVVTWNNPAANYKLENLIVEDRDNIINTGRIISEEAVAFGATTEGQALRYGRWKLWTAVNQTELVSFKTAINAAFIAPGDIINVQDSDRYPGNLKYSGRVSNTGTRNTTTIPLDREIELNVGSDYELSVLFTDTVATLAQDSATIGSVSYSRGDVIDSINIDTEEEASNILDDSGDYVDVTWKPYTNVETQTVSTSSGTGITSLITSAFSAIPSAESVWVLKESISGVEVEGSKKMYKILSISEESKNIYGITAVEFYNEKYAAVDENFVLSTQDPVFSPPTSVEIIPAPRNAYVVVSDLTSGQIKDDVILYWDTPVDSNGDFYDYIDYFEVSGNIPGFPTTMKVSRNQTSLSGLDLPIGTFTLAVRTIAQNGRRSDATRTTFTIENPARQAVPRAFGMALGATSSSPAFITSAGVFTIENQEYAISPAGYPQLSKQFDGTPAAEYTQDCSDIPSLDFSALTTEEQELASHYIMLDEDSADPLKLIKFYKDEDLGYSYFYDAGTGNTTHTSNWTSIGTVSVAANSNKVTGSGFDTSLQVGDLIKFSSTQAAKVVYVASATDVRIDKSFSTAISSVTGYKNSFTFDKDKDAVFYSVRNDGGTFKAFPVNYVVNPDLAQTIRFAKMSAEPGVLLFNADDTKNWEENSTLTLNIITTGFSNPEFKVTGAGFSFVDESADTVFSSSNIRTLTLSDTVTYTSTFPVFTVTVREKNDPLNIAKQKTDTLSLSLLKDGIAGSAGNVGLELYKATTVNSAPSVPSGSLTYNFEDGALTEVVPGNLNGWTEAVPSVSASTPYIWVTKAVALGAVGETTDTIETGDWAAPALYSEGPLNSAIVELFQVTSSSSAPADPTSSLTYTFSTTTLSGSGFNGWSQTATGTSEGEYLWKISAYALSNGTTDIITTDDWADAKIVGYSGTDGVPGTKTALVYAYQRSSSALTSDAGTVIVNLDTGLITTNPLANGWSKTIPSGTNPLYVIAASASGTGTEDEIAAGEWSDPVVLSQNGTAGLNTATVFIYQRTTTNTAPSRPTGNTTYTFSTGATSFTTANGWTRTIPSSGGGYLWVSQATAAATTISDTIAQGEWAVPVLLSQDGDKGNNGLRTIQGYLYYESTGGQPSAPSGRTYTFSTGLVSGTSINDGGTTNVWKNSPNTQDATSSNTYYTVRYYGTEASENSSTISVSYSNVVKHTSFTGVVTFSGGTLTDGSASFNPDTKLGSGEAAADINNNVTTIDGGKITANSIEVDKLTAGTKTVAAGKNFYLGTGQVFGDFYTTVVGGVATAAFTSGLGGQSSNGFGVIGVGDGLDGSGGFFINNVYGYNCILATDRSALRCVGDGGSLTVGGTYTIYPNEFTGNVGITSGSLTVDDGISTSSFGSFGSLICVGNFSAFSNANFGGGYGSTGVTISSTGSGSFNGNLTVDGAITAGSFNPTSLNVGGGYGSTGVTISSTGSGSFNGNLTVDGSLTAGSLTVDDGISTSSFGSFGSLICVGNFQAFSNAYFGGGYGVSGITLTSAGSGSFDGNVIVDGTISSGSTATFGGTTFIGGGYGSSGMTLQSDGTGFIDGNWIVDGSITAGGNITAYSDAKLKENLEVIPNALEKVSTLTGYTFDRVDTGENQTGLIAQDVLKVLPEAVGHAEDGTLTLAYGNLVGLLVEAIKELKEEIEELKNGSSN